jgi:hypothetical protein
MADTALIPYNTYSQSAELAIATPQNEDYLITCGTMGQQMLKRDVDFGVIPKTKKPSLFKSGAEKICMGYGLLQQYELIHFSEGSEKNPIFRYIFKCNLVKVVNGREYVLSCGFGSANTAEKRNGFNGAFDADNGTIKMAQKRALVAAALAISGLSDAFTQDMENEDFMSKAQNLLDTDKPESPISTAQIRRLYAIGGEAGLTANEVKNFLASQGYASTKQILQKDYNEVCELVANRAKEGKKND